jgi:hypothetical protein
MCRQATSLDEKVADERWISLRSSTRGTPRAWKVVFDPFKLGVA